MATPEPSILQSIRRYSHINWALTDQSMVSGANFLTGILLARYLGLREFGIFTLAWMAVLFANSLQFAMICSPMMSIAPQQAAADTPAYYGAVFTQQAAFALLSFVFIYIVVKTSRVLFPYWHIQHMAFPLATVAFACQMQDFMRRYFFTRDKAPVAFVNDAVRYLGQLGALIWLFQVTAFDSAGVLWIIAGTSAVAAAMGLSSLERMAWNRGTLATVTIRHWNFSKWLAGSALMQWTSGNLFVVAAGGILGAASVGALKAAQNVMGVTHILFQGLENIVPVRAASHYHLGGPQALVAYLRKVAWTGGLGTAAIAMMAAAFPKFWMNLFYGKEFLSYGNLLQWYAMIYLIVFIGLPLRNGLRAMEHTRPLFVAYLIATLFSLVAVYPLVHWVRLSGVMAGLLLTQLIMQTLLWGALKKQILVLKS